MTWQPLGAIDPRSLSVERVQLHWAAQLLSAPGNSMLPAESDFSHSNLGWLQSRELLVGRPVDESGLVAALAFEPLQLLVLGRDEEPRLDLASKTLREATSWLAKQLGLSPEDLQRPEHELPRSELATDGSFSSGSPGARSELGHWFANAYSVIAPIAAKDPRASEVRCWPHHFDLATLVTLSPQEARSIGVGFSPGDDSYDQPYFYVTPWPYPDPGTLPGLCHGGHWHTKGFTAAVLVAEEILGWAPTDQPGHIGRALREAFAALSP